MKPGEQHIADKDLLALGDVKGYVSLVGLRWIGFLRDIDLRVLESLIQVSSHNGVAVSGEVVRRKQLTGFGVHQRHKFFGANVFCPFNAHRTHALLLAFFDLVSQTQRCDLVLLGFCCACGFSQLGRWRGKTVVGGARFRRTRFGVNPHMGEAVVAIDRFERAHIGGDKRLAVCAVNDPGCRPHER